MIIFPFALLNTFCFINGQKFVLFQLGKISSMFQFALQVQPTSILLAGEKEHGSGWLASKHIWQG